MWIGRAELRRVLRRLKAAEDRIRDLENDLKEERERNRARENELLNRVLTAAGCYALPKEQADKPNKMAAPGSNQPTELTEMEKAIREAYRKAAAEAGHSWQEADAMFERRKRGELPVTDQPFEVN